MAQRILFTTISPGSGQKLPAACLTDEQHLIEARILRKSESQVCTGDLYIGKISRILPQVDAAIVRIRPGVSCFCRLEDLSTPFCIRKQSDGPLKAEDEILVQIIKEEHAGKLPMGSGRLSFAGRYLILTTGDTKFGVSKKCTSAEKKTFEALFAEKKDPAYGLIVRTNARNVSNQTLLEEYSKLHAQASKTLSEAVSRTCYTCLSEREEPALTYLKNTDLSSVKEIVSDDPVICENVRAYLKNLSEAVRPPVRLYEDSAFPLSKLYNLGRELERARLPKVWLKSGGYLMIERTEAMTVIDVNSAKSSHYKDAQAHYRSINEEAAKEIARQLRLRNIGGIIIVDFINLSSEEEKKQLLAALRKYCAPDPMPVNVCGITSLGLVELTRKKSQKSLEEQLTQA